MSHIKKTIPTILLALGAFSVYYFSADIKNYAEKEALEQLSISYGNVAFDYETELFIQNLAQELELKQPLTIRKMNSCAIKVHGYHNAFVAFPYLLHSIITFNKPHIFLSDGFFETLSLEEQRFLIGHELIHAREGHHCRYLGLILFTINGLGLIGLAICVHLFFVFAKKRGFFRPGYTKKDFFALCLFIISSCICLCGSWLGQLAYRRMTEKEADVLSVNKLNTHQGLSQLCDRWHSEYIMPFDYGYNDIFVSHPSLYKRKQYRSP